MDTRTKIVLILYILRPQEFIILQIIGVHHKKEDIWKVWYRGMHFVKYSAEM